MNGPEIEPGFSRRHFLAGAAGAATAAAYCGPTIALDPSVAASEAERVAVIKQVKPAVACVCFVGGKACGSGVVIDPEGYCLTNFHVVQPTGPIMQCGLEDGELYDTVLVGQDKVGDVALVKLLPKEKGKPFSYVRLGDSDQVQAGDWSLAMGNPFGISLDFNPTVTFGLISGVNRYQPPEGKGTLEYTDCIQFDTSINPGNSGGPLFNMKGELIGINGRGSFEKRGRVNSGVGYAISINQIKNFLGHFYAGIDTDHATLGAEIRTENEEGDLLKMVVRQVLEEADAYRRGLQPGDQILQFAGRHLTSVNQYKNILGIFPKEWRLPLVYRRNNRRKEMLVRLMGHQDVVIGDKPQPQPPGRPPIPGPNPAANNPANKLYESKKGFANYYFNKLEQDKLLGKFKEKSDFTGVTGKWVLDGGIELADRKGDLKISMQEGSDGLTEIKFVRSGIEDSIKPLGSDLRGDAFKIPQGSGGLLVALYQYRRMLTLGREGFEGGFAHGGTEPVYPPRLDGKEPESLKDLRVDCHVIRTKHAQFEAKWYFSKNDHTLVACETYLVRDSDPCELYFGGYKAVDGKQVPHRIEVIYGDKRYAVINLASVSLAKK